MWIFTGSGHSVLGVSSSYDFNLLNIEESMKCI